ncbi:MAG: flagellar protein FlaG [Desulfobacterales bacterium]|nr:flagellar protein FlaG [Desulfobacterales bacterium]
MFGSIGNTTIRSSEMDTTAFKSGTKSTNEQVDSQSNQEDIIQIERERRKEELKKASEMRRIEQQKEVEEQNKQQQELEAKRNANISQEKLDQLEQELSRIHNVGLQFAKHNGTGRTMVKVLNRDNNKLIREIPPEKVLDLEKKIDEMIGLIYDEKV